MFRIQTVAALLSIALVGFVGFGGSLARAQNAVPPPLETPVKEGDSLLIQGLNAQLTLTGQASGSTLKVKGVGEGQFTLERRDGVIVLAAQGSDNRKTWKENLKSWEKQKLVLEIGGPALPVEVHLRQGSVHLNRWNKDARVNLREGLIHIAYSNGHFRLSLNKGDIDINDSGGRLGLDLYQGSVDLKQVHFDADLRVLGGTVNLSEGKGHWNLTTSGAQTKMQKFSGTLQVDLNKGSLSATAFQGRAEGQTVEGGVTLSVLGDTDVNLKSQSGRLQVNLPTQGGALLNLSTQEGELTVPTGLRIYRGTNEKALRTRYRGEGTLSVTLRSQDGNILVK